MKIVMPPSPPSPPLPRTPSPVSNNVTTIGGARPWLARLPPGLFAIAFGLLGLAGTWQRLAGFQFALSSVVPDIAMVLLTVATSLLELLLLLWLIKWFRHRADVQKDFAHPVSGPMLSLAPLCILLAVALWVPVLGSHLWPVVAGVAGAALVLQAWIAWRVVSRIATGEMAADSVTPALYLPPLGGGLIGALALNALGFHAGAVLLFGVALGAWALLEARVLNRLFAGPLPPPLRATIGIEIAPASVATLVAATLWPALPVDVLLVGIGVSTAALVAVLARWRFWTAVPFSAGFWSFSFPLAALASAVIEAVRRGGWPIETAIGAAALASAVIAYLTVRTLLLLARGRLLPPG